MTQIDQFESVFRGAAKDVFEFKPIVFKKVLAVTDLAQEAAAGFCDALKVFLGEIPGIENVAWQVLDGGAFTTTAELLALEEAANPSLICTYRNLHSQCWQYPHSLGEHLDVLLQKTKVPVLVLPHPNLAGGKAAWAQPPRNIMAVTDHLSNEHRLVNYAVCFTPRDGRLALAHIQDEIAFERVMTAISKIATIDTDDARVRLRAQLLKEPADYIESCRNTLAAAGVSLTIDAEVRFGHLLDGYRQLMADHHIQLLVMNTKDDDQMAMAGLAYPLAIELRQIPILML